MDNILLILILLTALGILFFTLKNNWKKEGSADSLFLIQNQMTEMGRALESKLQSQFSESTKLVKDVTEGLIKISEGQKQLSTITDILKNPKQRGTLGEYSLDLILQNHFPQNYHKQHEFKDGTKVDFALIVRDKIIPIDSKFSLENYRRFVGAEDSTEKEKYGKLIKGDLETRIDETAKYIKPNEDTMDFAFMFIPGESLYYDLLVNKIGTLKENEKDLIDYAMSKHVVIVSPTSFLAYLETVMQGLKAMKIEESAKEIIKKVGELGRHINVYEDYMKKLGSQLGTTVNTYNKAYKELVKVDKDVLKISGVSNNVESLSIAGPEEDETE